MLGVLLRQRQAVPVDDRAEAVRAAGNAERLQGFLVPDEPAVHRRPALDDGGQPAVGELCPFAGHDHEKRSRSVGEAQAFEVGDGGDDNRTGRIRAQGALLPLPNVQPRNEESPLRPAHRESHRASLRPLDRS